MSVPLVGIRLPRAHLVAADPINVEMCVALRVTYRRVV